MTPKPYQQSAEDVAHELDSWPAKGLSSQEIAARQEKYGPNTLEADSGINPLGLFLSQFKDVLIIILIIAATISLALSYVGGDSSGTVTLTGEQKQTYYDEVYEVERGPGVLNCQALIPECGYYDNLPTPEVSTEKATELGVEVEAEEHNEGPI